MTALLKLNQYQEKQVQELKLLYSVRISRLTLLVHVLVQEVHE